MSSKNVSNYFDQLSYGWTSRYSKDSFVRRRSLFYSQIFDGSTLPSKVLDIGCGSGDLTNLFIDKDISLFGIDVSAGMIARCQERFSNTPHFCFSTISPGSSLGFEDDSFDLIVCSSVIEYVDDLSLFISELTRVLAPGGRLLVSAPATFSPVRLIQKFLRLLLSPICDVFAYLAISRNSFTRASLGKLLSDSGLDVISLLPFYAFDMPLANHLPPSLFLATSRKPF